MVLLTTMEEGLRSEQRRVYAFDVNAMTYAAFSYKYMSFLLPALLRAASGGKTAQIEKIVRFEVDMALVSSVGDFKWSRALKHELEEGRNPNNLHASPKCRSEAELNTYFGIPRPIVLVDATRPKKASGRITGKRTVRGDEELACHIRILRRALPGGGEMSVYELLSEMESYVVCLQLQVDVLRSLVDAQ